MTAPADLAPCGTSSAWARHYRRGEPADEACREANRRACAAARAAGVQQRQEARRREAIAWEVASIPGAKPFQIPRCASCGAPLCDGKGEPRWDLLEERFVCLGRCVGRGGEGGSRG